MTEVLWATLAGSIALVAWGVGDWLTAKSSKQHPEFDVNFSVQLPGAVILSCIMLVYGFELPAANDLLAIVAGGLLFTLAYLLFITALSKGSVGIVVPLANTYPLITLVLSLIFLEVILSSMQLGAIFVIIVGATFLAYEKNHKKIPIKVLHRETMLALTAGLLWGSGFFALNSVIDRVPWYMVLGIDSVIMGIFSGMILLGFARKDRMARVRKSLTNKSGLLAGVIVSIGAIGLYMGSEQAGSLIIPVIIASGAPLVASLLGALVDKEKIGLFKRAGAFLVVSGIILLNIFK